DGRRSGVPATRRLEAANLGLERLHFQLQSELKLVIADGRRLGRQYGAAERLGVRESRDQGGAGLGVIDPTQVDVLPYLCDLVGEAAAVDDQQNRQREPARAQWLFHHPGIITPSRADQSAPDRRSAMTTRLRIGDAPAAAAFCVIAMLAAGAAGQSGPDPRE